MTGQTAVVVNFVEPEDRDTALDVMRDQLEHIADMAEIALAGFGVATPEGIHDTLIDVRHAMRHAVTLIDHFARIGEAP